jgi:hypothetical protein
MSANVFSEGKTSDNMAIREGDCHMFETQYNINISSSAFTAQSFWDVPVLNHI